MPSPNLRQISREKLFRIFKDEELVRLFEDILTTLNETLPGDTTQVEEDLANHIADTTDAHQASAIGVTPAGGISAINVQAALVELDTGKVSVSAVGTIAAQDANNVAITGGTIGLASGSLGYAVGNGGTVTQAASKSTGVTLNKMSGDITMDAANLAAGAKVTFVFTNSSIAATDLVLAEHVSAGTSGSYKVQAHNPAAGSCSITVKNDSAGALAEAIVIRFLVLKAATS